ncbi:hypothetical protein EUBVEN_00472 [Eubacterium ventriosum ATCC 27560]|uniref:Uncharacterized protein n=1 Tax=Eubacterium ventriosum ATCC 27560 TaxID=411463 RepID=A5Z467_9FIRM|nr:hypothetical protein EUBVEN_00472 [Eubacterium ventriosum ATCC 27560]
MSCNSFSNLSQIRGIINLQTIIVCILLGASVNLSHIYTNNKPALASPSQSGLSCLDFLKSGVSLYCCPNSCKISIERSVNITSPPSLTSVIVNSSIILSFSLCIFVCSFQFLGVHQEMYRTVKLNLVFLYIIRL